MYIRLTQATGSRDRAAQDAAADRWKTTAVPVLRAEKGYVGCFIAAQTNGEACTASYWQDAAALEASEAQAAAIRARAAEISSELRDVRVDSFEVLLLERAKAPSGGMHLRSNDLSGADPEKVAAFVRDRVYPVVAGQPGFRSVMVAANRATGRTIVATTWESLADLERSEAAVTDLREEAVRATGASGVKVETWEVPFIEMVAQPNVGS